MAALTVTLTTHAVAYNLWTLITANSSYTNARGACRELNLLGGPGNAAAKIFVGDALVSSTNFGQQLIASQSTTYRSADTNAVSLGDRWVTSDTDGAKLNVEWSYA